MTIFGISLSAFLELVCFLTIIAYSQYIPLRAGVFSIATPGFVLLGAYASAVLQMRAGMPAVVAVLVSVLIGALLGAALGYLVRRLRGMYQGIATLAFVVLLQEIAREWDGLTGGAFGLVGIPNWGRLPVLIALLVITIVGVIMLDRSITGMRMSACRIDEVASASLGVDVAGHRLVALTLSGALGALGGVALGANQFAITPEGFGFSLVVSTLIAVVVGGYRVWAGPLVGILVLQLIGQGFSSLGGWAAIVQGGLLLFVMIFMPEGIAGGIRDYLKQVKQRRLFRAQDELPEHVRTDPVALEKRNNTDVLRVAGVGRSYAGVKAVGAVSFDLAPGQILGLIGPNGAGKSTVINLLSGHTRLDHGTVQVADREVQELPPYQVTRSGIARTFQTCRLYEEFSVLENVEIGLLQSDIDEGGRLARSLRGVSKAAEDQARALLAQVGALHLADRPATSLTYSDQRRVEIARALATGPDFLLLDEPAAGMRRSETQELGELIQLLARQGLGVLVIDHNVGWILGLCEHVMVQQLGELIFEGMPEEVRNDQTVKTAYLG